MYSIFGATVMCNSEHYSTIAESPSDNPSLSGTLLSDSDSNSDSDTDVSGGKLKDPKLKLPSSGSASKREKTPLKLTKGHASLLSNSTNHTAASCSPLNLQVIKTPNIVTSSSALAYHSSPSSSYSLAMPPGNRRQHTLNAWYIVKAAQVLNCPIAANLASDYPNPYPNLNH